MWLATVSISGKGAQALSPEWLASGGDSARETVPRGAPLHRAFGQLTVPDVPECLAAGDGVLEQGVLPKLLGAGRCSLSQLLLEQCAMIAQQLGVRGCLGS